ncbi:MAG: hypothetical protein OXC38_08535, partial [Gammaproteobacteria bacterium]|nr:hypothetical protein [Gammaproteobacteria bacterium]
EPDTSASSAHPIPKLKLKSTTKLMQVNRENLPRSGAKPPATGVGVGKIDIWLFGCMRILVAPQSVRSFASP